MSEVGDYLAGLIDVPLTLASALFTTSLISAMTSARFCLGIPDKSIWIPRPRFESKLDVSNPCSSRDGHSTLRLRRLTEHSSLAPSSYRLPNRGQPLHCLLSIISK